MQNDEKILKKVVKKLQKEENNKKSLDKTVI